MGQIKSWLPVSLACSIAVLSAQFAFAAPGDVNSVNEGQNIQSGTYFNTEGSRTTFQNSAGGGLHLRAGDLVRGLESNAGGTPTGNGGTLYFRAPGNVIRLDGNIDVSALKNNSMYLGNGGKVFLDSAFLFQNGSILANGFNGGLIQYNVGSMTVGPNARITAQGFGGNGGAININSPGIVDIRNGAILDTSGKVIGTFDTNVINIEGGIVNNDGIIRANGLAVQDFKTNSDASLIALNPSVVNNPAPGTISGGNGQGIIMGAPQPFAAPGAAANRGGTIRLVATGKTYSTNNAINQADADLISSAEKTSLVNRNNQLLAREGGVINSNTLQANGAPSNNGGTVLLAAADDVSNFGTISVNGGNGTSTSGNGTNAGHGGTISINTMDRIVNHGFIQSNGGTGGNAAGVNVSTGTGQDAVANVTSTAGTGGNAGLIAFSYNTMENRGKIEANGGTGGVGGNANAFDSEVAPSQTADATARATANPGAGGQGGNGGLIVFSGNANPTGGGWTTALGGRGGRGGNASADARVVVRDGNGIAITNTSQGAAGTGGLRGTVVAPNPGNFPSDQTYRASAGGPGNTGTQQRTRVITKNGVSTTDGEFISAIGGATNIGPHNTIEQTRRNELLTHQENALLLSRGAGAGTNSTLLSGRLSNAIVRNVANPLGQAVTGLSAAQHAGNFVVASTTAGGALTNDFVNGNANPIFTNLNSLTLLNDGSIDNDMHWAPGVHQVGPGFHDITFSLAGGHHSWISTGSIVNDGFILTRGLWNGGSINLAANQGITNNNVTMNIAFNKHTASGFTPTPGYISSHTGSTILKAGTDIVNNDKLNDLDGFGEVHPPLNGQAWLPTMNAGQIGSTVYALAGNNIINNSGAHLAADVFNYRDGSRDGGAQNPTNSIGGIMTLRAGGTVTNNGTISADATSLFGNSGNFKFSSTAGLTVLPSTDGEVIEE